MANTISISPKPGIKCYVGDNKLCNTLFHNTAYTTLEKIKKLPDKELRPRFTTLKRGG